MALAGLDAAAGTSATGEWGTPIEGIQCRIKPAKLASPEQTPKLEAFVRRGGKVDLLLSTVQTPKSRLIVDGRPYRHEGENLTGVAYHPGSNWQNGLTGFSVTLDNRWLSVDDGTPLSLAPGKHTVQYGWPGCYPMPESPEGGLRPDASKPILLMSNKVEIDVLAKEVPTEAVPGKTTVRGEVVDDATGEPVTDFFTEGGKSDPADPEKVVWGYSETRSGIRSQGDSVDLSFGSRDRTS